ncbi:hypothetical protein [Acetivibrio cellulolyticus]|nr:hypothetical protein [Acetivibrio cellulolyticus]
MTKGQFKEAFRRGLGSTFLGLKNSNYLEEDKDIVTSNCNKQSVISLIG